MRRGELTTYSPRRLVVTLDWFAKPDTGLGPSANRALHRWSKVARSYRIDRGLLSDLERKSFRLGFKVELAAIGIHYDEADALMERLDSGYVNPFCHHEVYATTGDLASTLPLRTELIGVLSPSIGPYGSWAFDYRSI